MRANMPPTGHRQVNEKPFKIAINSRESAPFYPLDLQKTRKSLPASPTASSRRSGYYIHCPVTVSTPEPEGRARCVSSARRDLCGGRLATAVPTVTYDCAIRRFESCRRPSIPSQPVLRASCLRISQLICGVLGGCLCVAHRLLRIALCFLRGALHLKLVRTNDAPNTLFDLARGFIGEASDFVCSATHRNLS